ncbi:formylglycine-generating enzyme family protein [Brevibacterium yomogidense]|uniref:Sulfatase modifying factor 1 (C-alpha-formyglycine-generating enzyme 1) n=1 Tax=Brevibacterium yomogidense TaxID=946573 RepID=A0A1X6XJ01_9MICO|nr:formylglycine-generating enzyme family protein [Brevibacterium yomogidense]SLM99274.1 Sulfatase modifying factor 1 precursor (C-alpha-formyglycine-generating enzyme 1) [Brevibacterium yomogidense]
MPAAGETAGPPAALLERLTAAAGSDLRFAGLPGGSFRMGAEDALAYPADGEGPVRSARVAPFAIATTTVTTAQFAAFVKETGHRTDAEVLGTSLVFSGLLPAEVRAAAPAVLATPWWREVAGATWFQPEGPGSSVVAATDAEARSGAAIEVTDSCGPSADRAAHPVTHVSQRDALAYAEWVGARLPTETEWEYASRGGLDQQPYPWGAQREPGGEVRMSTFPGQFPDGPTGPVGTVAADAFPPNGYGLHNTTGNVWEWTVSTFGDDDPRPVLRGGSYMCHASYCRRYRTSARTAASADTSLGHTGFRLAVTTD